MGPNFIYVIYAAMILLVLVLASGLWAMTKGDKQKSQKMMRWRLGVQAALLGLVILFVFAVK